MFPGGPGMQQEAERAWREPESRKPGVGTLGVEDVLSHLHNKEPVRGERVREAWRGRRPHVLRSVSESISYLIPKSILCFLDSAFSTESQRVSKDRGFKFLIRSSGPQ